jgi:nitrite reductase/ring-hydroxylating ferredoxin subunit
MTNRHGVCPTDSLGPGERLIATVEDRSIGVFNVDGEYFAVQNFCPHMGAPLCEGRQTGTGTYDEVGKPTRERSGEIIRCPWHGWEFDIETGETSFNPHRYQARTFKTTVETPCNNKTCGSDVPDVDEPDSGETEFAGEPPIDTFETAVEDDVVVVHV